MYMSQQHEMRVNDVHSHLAFFIFDDDRKSTDQILT